MAAKRLPPFEIRRGEGLFIYWPHGADTVEVQLRQPGTSGVIYTARATYPMELFHRPPSAATADWIRQELEDEFRKAREVRRTNRPPKKPRW